MKVLIMFTAILAVATAQWGYPYYGYSPNTAIQNSNANSGFGGTSIASGTANANMGYGVPLLRGKRSPDPQYYPYPYYGNYAPNTAAQTSNANSGFGGTSIASGTANANMGGYGVPLLRAAILFDRPDIFIVKSFKNSAGSLGKNV
ncbi:unnamed protein product [Allacma fusca]|uniref:Uncharacterized protein n=1 Tax=Allacma fusca TaxID=39272 RepID=A0A8J2L2L1_9HEXA|nr:unnamed protein product [Allacma fusca]